MPRPVRPILAALPLLAATLPAVAQIRLTADDVARRATATSATLAARRAEVVAARAAVTEARIALLPRVVGSARYARHSLITAPTLGNLVVTPEALHSTVLELRGETK